MGEVNELCFIIMHELCIIYSSWYIYHSTLIITGIGITIIIQLDFRVKVQSIWGYPKVDPGGVGQAQKNMI